MKNLYFLFLSIIAIAPATAATVPWWMRPTVCKINPTNCYSNMTNGYFVEIGNSESWDDTSNCWGLKIICPAALTTGGNKPVALKRDEIKSGKIINPDFDTNALSASRDCFGVRKTAEGGTKVSVDGKLVNVWCPGILSRPDEILENGEISYEQQPSCKELAKNNYAAVENGTCYGKYYESSQYYIECGTGELPNRLIVLNGADYNTPMNGAPETKEAANKIFDTMYSVSKENKLKYFAK